MTDPYTSLGKELASAARRQATHRGAFSSLRTWLARHINATAAGVILALGGTAVAVAATGVLGGAPVKPEVTPSPVAGNGLPIEHGAHPIAPRVADPDGGMPWGMRVLRTTRGEICAQVGRIQAGQLGELGLDDAFSSDGRFHTLSPEVLPPGYGGSQGNIECVLAGQTLIFENTGADRSAVRLLPEEFGGPSAKHGRIPPVEDLRTLSFGLLGPHAMSVTYRTPAGLRTVAVTGPDGAFLIVEPARAGARHMNIGGSISGEATANSVEVVLPSLGRVHPIVSAVTFRFGGHMCSQGSGAPTHQRCPSAHLTAPRRWFTPTRNLHAPVGLTLLPQSQAACKAAFLLDPCYKGQIQFTAPYSLSTAASDYNIEAIAKCKVGGRPETDWNLERNVSRHEMVRTNSLGLFVFTPSCASSERFEVRYINQRGPTASSPHESVILGSVPLNKATLPGGAPVTAADAPSSSG